MDKAPDAYRTISEVAEDLDLPQHVLRFWETRFGQIKPLKRGGGRRYYRPDDVELLKGIRHLLYKEGYTIKGVQRILKEQGVKAVQAFVRETMADPAYAPLPPSLPRPEPVIQLEPAPAFAPVSHSPAAMAPEPVQMQVRHTEDDEEPPFDDEPEGAHHEPVAPAPAGAAPPPLQAMHAPAAMAVAVEPEPAIVVPSAPRPQVSMFRGGLQRAESATPEAHSSLPVLDAGRSAETPGVSSRDALMMALDELQACRATIDRLLARRAG